MTNVERFSRWDSLDDLLDRAEKSMFWVRRDEAEQSTTLVQPIAAAVLHDGHGALFVVKRSKKTRSDLRQRLSVVFGGHVDVPEHIEVDVDFLSLLRATLLRELAEEFALIPTSRVEPLGVIFDVSSVMASRHVAFVFEAKIAHSPKALAGEEFALRSKHSAYFAPPHQLLRHKERLDPWSRILIEDAFSAATPGLAAVQLQWPLSEHELAATEGVKEQDGAVFTTCRASSRRSVRRPPR